MIFKMAGMTRYEMERGTDVDEFEERLLETVVYVQAT
jgi:hypothetical protein